MVNYTEAGLFFSGGTALGLFAACDAKHWPAFGQGAINECFVPKVWIPCSNSAPATQVFRRGQIGTPI